MTNKKPRRSIVTTALTVDEKSLIESHAKSSGMTVSSYSRLILLDAHPITLEMIQNLTMER